jgi:Putative adhesin
MTGAQRRMLIIGLVPVLVLVVTGAALTVSLIRGKLPYSYSGSYVPGPQGVRIESDVPAELLASVDGRVHVTVDGSYAVAQPDIRIATVGGVLTIDTSCPDFHCAVDLAVEVPAQAKVQAKVERAPLDVAGVASPLSVDASDGSVDMTRLRSPEVSVDAQRGSISLLFDNAPDRVTATASDGSLTVKVPRISTYAIDAVAAQGSTELDIPNDPSATHRLYLRTSYGSITVQ